MSIHQTPTVIATGIASFRHKPTGRVWEAEIPPNLKLVLLAIVDHADDEGRNSYPSQETLAQKTGYSVRQVKRIIAELRSLGLLDVACASLPERATMRQPNVYRVVFGDLQTSALVTCKDQPEAPLDDTPPRGHPCPPKYVLTTYQNGMGKNEKSTDGKLRAGLAARPGGNVILGRDPEAVEVAQLPTKKSSADLPALVAHFVRHPTIVMTRSYSDHDTMILRKSLKALLNTGVSRTTVLNMIDRFYAIERFRLAERPVLLFSKKDIQQELIAKSDAMVSVSDPVLELMMHEFVRPSGLDLPWSPSFDADLRSAVLNNGMDACFRYPELVASLASQYPGDFRNPDFLRTLSTLNDYLLCITDEYNTTDLQQFINILSESLQLPKELRKPSIKTIRKDTDTIAEAVYAYRRCTNV